MGKGLKENDVAFSSTLDAIFFLVLVSISAVILMPTLAAEDQYTTAGYISSQEMDDHLLCSLLSSRTEDFGYTFRPLGAITDEIFDNRPGDIETVIYGREQKHRCFADMIAESLVLGLEIRDEGTVPNTMTADHTHDTIYCIEE